ncbi:MAG TPA: pyruvate, phosphate dikinase [Thermohalobaculum sp.]|nr:pyruvate, phosphate dikinase [Thermohalobaculum sp.]
MKADIEQIGWIGCDPQAGGALDTGLDRARYGEKAHWLSRAAALGLPVPRAFVLPGGTVRRLAEALDGGQAEEAHALLDRAIGRLEAASGRRLGDPERPLLLSLRPSAAGGGAAAPAILNIGMAEATLPAIEAEHGARTAQDLYRRLIQSYGAGALGVEGEDFEYALYDKLKDDGIDGETELGAGQLAELAAAFLALIEADGEGAFPQDARGQVAGAIAAMARAWDAPRARTRRLAKDLAEDAPLALIVQEMVMGLGPEPSGAGIARLRSELTGETGLSGRYLAQAQGEEALMGLRTPLLLTRAEQTPSGPPERTLEEAAPGVTARLAEIGERLEQELGDAFVMHFTLAGGALSLLELAPARRAPRAAIRIAVELAEKGAITRDEAMMRIDPAFLEDHLHPSIDPAAKRDVIALGLPASPGAAAGELVFSPDAAEAAAAAGRPAILALIETGPEDIRGMHAARGVLTVRGGMTSHAAVVARGLGRPCVCGAKGLVLDRARGVLAAADGREFHAGSVVTVVGSDGQVLAGAAATVEPEITGAFARLLEWADAARRLGVRANADTAQDAAVARGFNAEGIGLCRTEHMFFKRGRILPMREMIMAEDAESRRAALARLRTMQKGDFVELFHEMAGLPVVIRLLDPPLHEFLPHGDDELSEMAETLDVPLQRIRERAEELAEFNPMLGKRGCRIGIAFPEIYAMQAHAILEAACDAGERTGEPVVPEIMIPLVSAVRELEVLARVIGEAADEVRAAQGGMVDYTIGVMIETPRACLRGGDFAAASDFLSFGTNDLTQMVYGLSRDDVGRFMPDYVSQGIYDHDPFHSLDVVGVGEMMQIATERARAARPGITIGLCGEHGADPASVDFCEHAGFTYVSCSPYRVPIARLAAAQAAIRARREAGPDE